MAQKAFSSPQGRFLGLILGVAACTLPVLSAAHAADLQSGVVKYQAGDYEGALAEWRPLAEKNDPNALFNIGQAYRLGRGVKEDPTQALGYYQRAGALGHVAAQGNAGTLLFFSNPPVQNKEQAISWWQRAATNGDPRSQYMLGILHFNGEGLPKDWPRAYALTLQSRDAGLPEASKSIGQMEQYLTDADKAAGITLVAQYKTAQASGRPVITADDNRAAVSNVRKDIAAATRAAATPGSGDSVSASAPVVAPTIAPIATPKNVAKSPAKAAMTEKAASSGKGGWRVQLGAFSSEAAAERAWQDMSGKNAALAEAGPNYSPTGTGSFRLQAGNYPTRIGADALCAQLKAENTPCFVVKAQ
jgi:uncharacterized protein